MILVVLIVAGVTVFALVTQNDQNTAKQQELQTKLAGLQPTDLTETASTATQLIEGRLSGKYHFSDKLLAQYYWQGATAYYNLRQYPKAIAYYQAAPKYDSTLTQAALEGEVFARYKSGQRQELIPLLQKLASMTKYAHNGPTAEQYQLDIKAIQAGRDPKL